MSRYADTHHPDVIARKLASGLPTLNSWSKSGWRWKLAEDFGITLPVAATKTEMFIAWRRAHTERLARVP